MRRFDFRIFFGGALIFFGGLLLLEKMGILRGAAGLFWGLLFLLGAGYFFQIFLRKPDTHWWAIIPSMVFFGIGAGAILPMVFGDWGGALFLGSIGIAFWLVYLTDRSRWWGIIPGGVLLTLAAITLVDNVFNGAETGGLFFLGLGLTFFLVALLPNSVGKMGWAYIPGAILVVMGALLGGRSAGLAAYLWPVVLILIGGALLFFYFFKRE